MTAETLYPPLIITSRLCAGLRVGDTEISLEPTGNYRDHKPEWRYYVDGPSIEYTAADLYGPTSGAEAVETFLSFVLAYTEGKAYETATGRKSDNGDMFPDTVGVWLCEVSSELEAIHFDLSEGDA